MKPPLRYLLSLILLTTGTLHLLHAQNFANIIPDFLPFHLPIAILTGLCELAAAVGLQIPDSLDHGKTRRLTALLLTLFFIAVFPANLHMALHPDRYPLGYSPYTNQLLFLLRLPLQLPLIAWAWWYRRP